MFCTAQPRLDKKAFQSNYGMSDFIAAHQNFLTKVKVIQNDTLPDAIIKKIQKHVVKAPPLWVVFEAAFVEESF